ncbi:MAG TPA: gluconokinase [Sphingomonas sp.]|nr:gluconokinase [Sphingomonas sp.]
MIGGRGGEPLVLVMMGVSGCGKTSVGKALAERIGCVFKEGDELHPAANVGKMKAGHPLNDADRAPWLDAVAGWIAARERAGEWGVISCSALKRAYRDRLRRAGAERLRFVLLDPDEATLKARLVHRTGHYMPASLLASQLATLECPAPDEAVLRLEGTGGVDEACDKVMAWLNVESGDGDGHTGQARL